MSMIVKSIRVRNISDDTGHVHTLFIPKVMLENPKDSVDLPTSHDARHRHHVTLSKEELVELRNGKMVEKTTTSDGPMPHTHKYRIKGV